MRAAPNKETLLEIINNANISETQKQEAVNSMISMTDIALVRLLYHESEIHDQHSPFVEHASMLSSLTLIIS